MDNSYPGGKSLEAPNLKEFSFTDLKAATENFNSDSVLGEGGFGQVSKGWVDEKTLAPSNAGTGMAVDIKKLNSESKQGFKEWQIYNAKISGFGMAILGPSGGDSHVTDRVMVTYGCAALEYVATGNLYVKSDVYGFGEVLLEMLSGLQVFDENRPIMKRHLVDWLKPSLRSKRTLKNIMEARMEGKYSTKAALLAAQLILKCIQIQSEPRKRPAMKEVVETLEGIEAIK